ncbi:MAG: sigma-54 dependent transcriptional regulator [Myxococcota bacterium]
MALQHHPVTNRILIVDDEASLRTVLSALLRKEGFDVTAVGSAKEALDLLQNSQHSTQHDPFDVLIADLRMPEMDGMQLLQKTTQQYPDLPVIILTAHGTVDIAVQALKQGAFDFLTKPYEREEIAQVLRKAVVQRGKILGKTHSTNVNQQQELIIGASPQMQTIQNIIQRVADTPTTVLITGEPGTGKELVAQALHAGSSRHAQPFICMNCAAIPVELLESELFGYEKGIATATSTNKPGRFELAQGGTLLLDEVGHLPTNVQAKLLHVLQKSIFESVDNEPTPVDVRLIASTNQDLQQAIAQRTFREDLYYRLNVAPIHLPALRERPQDIPQLVQHFTKKYNTRLGKQIERFSAEAMHLLQAYSWPGNVRELENVVERTLLFADTHCIAQSDLPPEILAQVQTDDPATAAQTQSGSFIPMKTIVRKKTAQIERVLIETALKETGGNVTRAAQKLKISRKSLQLKMKELGLRDSPPHTFAV